MTKNDRIVKKIKKLLELSSSPNKHEAQLAMSRAQEMLARYSINLLEHETKPEQIVEEFYKWDHSIPFESFHLIATAVSKIFSCIAVGDIDHLRIFGMPTNIKIAIHALDCILNQLKVDYKKEKIHYRSISFFHSFWCGAARGIHEKFSKQETRGIGLVVYNKTREYLKNLNYQTTYYIINNSEGYKSGKIAAKQAQIRSGVDSKVQGNLLT